MDFLTIFFVTFSLIIILYLYSISKIHKTRVPIFVEIFFIGAYFFVLLIFLFPDFLNVIEVILGIQSAINFIVYLSIFVSYFLIFLLYKKTEDQRIELTRLNREVALKRNEKKKN